MSRFAYAFAAALCVTLGGCSSMRLGGFDERPPVRAANPAPELTPSDPIDAAPSGAIASAPLAPIESQPLSPVGGSPMPSSSSAAPGDVAALPQPSLPAPAAPSRTAMVGNWILREASGESCRVQLSSSPALDLYKASAANCANKDLAKLNAWDYRNGEVYLYQRGGSVVARMRSSGSGLEGVLSKSRAPLSMAR